MLLKYFYDEHLAQASYLVGCVKTGEAMVVDPARAIAPYLEAAEKAGLRITHVTETHIHADFVSGSRELAAREPSGRGATIYLSAMGGPEWQYAYADANAPSGPNVTLVRDGDSWMVGNVRIEAVHTPGHTPEHLTFLVTDTLATDTLATDTVATSAAERYIGAFTGDFLFVGDVGRPDLLEEAVGVVGSAQIGARQLFQSLRRFRELPDYLQIWPGHGAGSACGKALGAVPSTTLGYEKLFNPAFHYEDETEFVAWLLDGQPEAPRYFAQMKRVNKQGPALLRDLPEVPHLPPSALENVVKRALQGEALAIDFRSADEFNRMYALGTINIPATEANFSTYVGWFVDYDSPLYLILPAPEDTPDDAPGDVQEVIAALRAIGVDNIAGYFGPEALCGSVERLPVMAKPVQSTISATEVAARLPQNGMTLLDVRGKSEYRGQHIAGAQHIPLGKLPSRLNDLPHDETLVVHCASGYRSQIAASLLRAKGFDNVVSLDADTETWSRLLPVERN